MRLGWLAWVVLPACTSLSHFPEGNGGGGRPVGGVRPDAWQGLRADAAPFTERVLGQVCRLGDLADRGDCQPVTGVALTVAVGAATATLDASGSFDLPSPASGTTALVTVTGNATWLGAARTVFLDGNRNALDVRIPLLGRADLARMVTASGALGPLASEGVLVVQVDSAAATPLAGVTLGQVAGVDPLYDTIDPDVYLPDVFTHARGVGLYLGVSPQTAVVDWTAASLTGSVQDVVVADSLTLVTALVEGN